MAEIVVCEPDFRRRWRESCREGREPAECSAHRIASGLGEWIERLDDKISETEAANEKSLAEAAQVIAEVPALTEAVDKLWETAAELVEKVAALSGGFPDDDPAGHRRAHEEIIAAARARKEFWQKLLFELAKWGLIGFVGWAVIALWSSAVSGPGR